MGLLALKYLLFTYDYDIAFSIDAIKDLCPGQRTCTPRLNVLKLKLVIAQLSNQLNRCRPVSKNQASLQSELRRFGQHLPPLV